MLEVLDRRSLRQHVHLVEDAAPHVGDSLFGRQGFGTHGVHGLQAHVEIGPGKSGHDGHEDHRTPEPFAARAGQRVRDLLQVQRTLASRRQHRENPGEKYMYDEKAQSQAQHRELSQLDEYRKAAETQGPEGGHGGQYRQEPHAAHLVGHLLPGGAVGPVEKEQINDSLIDAEGYDRPSESEHQNRYGPVKKGEDEVGEHGAGQRRQQRKKADHRPAE